MSNEDAIKTADLFATKIPRSIPFRLEHRFKAVENYSDLKDAINRLIKFLKEDIQRMEQLLSEVVSERE